MNDSAHTCYVCGSDDCHRRPGAVRNNERLYPLECQNCGHVFLSSSDHISDSYFTAAANTGIPCDPHIVSTVVAEDQVRRLHDYYPLLTGKVLLDFGCGDGSFLSLAKTFAREVHGVDPGRHWRPTYERLGLHVHESLAELPPETVLDVITSFVVFGHIPDPLPVLRELRSRLRPGSGRLIMELQNADDALLTLYECELFSRFTYSEESPFVYSTKSLRMLMEMVGFNVLEIRQYQRYPLANHLHWLARGEPGGQIKWDMLSARPLNELYARQLAALGKCDTIIGTFSRS